jgi:hypothetical protein
MLIKAALLLGNLSSHLAFSFFVIAKVTVPSVLVPQHSSFESGFSLDTDLRHSILLVPYIPICTYYRGPDQGHLYPNLEVPGLTCPGRDSNPGLPRGKRAL